MFKQTLIAAAAAALLAGNAFAAPGGGHGKGASVGAGASMGAGKAHVSGHGSPSLGSGSINSNARGSLDRDTGMDRAMERRSTSGTLNANNPGSPTRATGADRAADRHDMHSSATVITREQRMAEALANWERTRR